MIKLNQKKIFLVTIIALVMIAGCTAAPSEPAPAENTPLEISYKFDEGDQGWRGEFANVPAVTAGTEYNLRFAAEDIPVAGQESRGLMLQGNNVGEMIFMYTYVKLDHQEKLEKNTNYQADLSLVLGTNVASNAAEMIDNVFIKAGIVSDMPMLNEENDLKKLNLDIGDRGVDSQTFRAMGNIGKINSDDDSYQYKRLETTFDVTTTDQTDLYLLIGIELNAQGALTAYIDDVKVILNKK